MSCESLELVELGFKTVPDDYQDVEQPHISAYLPYQRVIEVSVDDETLGRRKLELPNPNGREVSHRSFQVIPDFASTLFEAARPEGGLNCHAFARAMINFRGNWAEGWQPITQAFKDQPEVESLPLGAIGLIGVTIPKGSEVVHSVIGLGEDKPESIQVLSTEGELGIAANEDVVDYYRRYYDASKAGLYAVSEEEIARLQQESVARFEAVQRLDLSLERMSTAARTL